MPQDGETQNDVPDLDKLISEMEAGPKGDPGTGEPSGSPGNGDATSGVDFQKEIELPKLGKVKLSDLVSAYGRQKVLQRDMEKFRRFNPVIQSLEKDPALLSELMEEIKSRDNPDREEKEEPDDDGEFSEAEMQKLAQTNPAVRFFMREREQEKLAREHDKLDREEREVKSEFKLDDKQVNEVRKTALRYGGIPLRAAVAIWQHPQLIRRGQEIQTEQSARSSGIPGGRITGILSRKKPEDMTDSEMEQAMLEELLKHKSGT